MITSSNNYTKKEKNKETNKKTPERQNPRTNGKSKAIQTKSHKVHHLNFGMFRCLFRYSRDSGYIKLIVGILSICMFLLPFFF